MRALARGDSPMATASPAQRWVLIEQPGPWGREALAESRFDAEVAPLLAKRSRAENVRLLLVRRPGDRLADSGRRWAYADSRPGREGLWWSTRASDADLLTAPWDGSVGEPAPGPTYLVCTHGGHDACCALRGRPLARALPAPGPADVWECSHLGGDRFAANVLVLPHGFYYGQVPGDGAEVVAAHQRGQVALPGCAVGPACRSRRRRPSTRPRRARPARPRRPAGVRGAATDAAGGRGGALGGHDDGPGRRRGRDVESRPSTEAARLTCRATHPAHSRIWQVSLARSARGRGR